MTTSHGPRKRLPKNPSEENLRKQAKRLAKQEGLQLAAAQRRSHRIRLPELGQADARRGVALRAWFRCEHWLLFRRRSIRSMSADRSL